MTAEETQNSQTARELFAHWCWSKALPFVVASLVPMVLAGVVGSISAYSSAQEGAKNALKDQNAQIQQLQQADKSFKEYLEERRNVRDKQFDKIDSAIGDLKKDTLSKDIFDAYWQSYKDDKADREARDKMILEQLQRINH